MRLTEHRRGGRSHNRTVTLHDGPRIVATARPDRRETYLLHASDFCWLDPRAGRADPHNLRVRTLREARTILAAIADPAATAPEGRAEIEARSQAPLLTQK